MNAKHPAPEQIVRAHHRAARSIPALGVLAAGLAVTLGLLWLAHPSFAPVQHWRQLGAGWMAGLALSLAGTAVCWRLCHRTLLRSAAEIDAALATHNRLETATALFEAQDALARAQREETEQFLRQLQLAPRRGWLNTLVIFSVAIALAHLVTLVCWTRPLSRNLAAEAAATTPEEKKTATLPSASIEWHSPETEAVATAIEEVPLEAVADSACGLRDTVLEVEVNGEHKLSQPLKDDLTKPGRHTLKLSIYLDQLEVKTYDVASYHLRAHRIAPGKLPPTVSAVQFVQIRPMREDTFVCAGGDKPSKCFSYVTALKTAQLRLMKENFALANAENSRESDDWREENARVGAEQGQLAERADEVITLMTENHYPEEVLGLVRQSQPLMGDAGAKILKSRNQPALAPQGKALGYLAEVEKYLAHSIKLAGQSQQPNANDPFQKPKNLDLKTHPLTRAGKVDKLAEEQAKLAGDLASNNTNAIVRLPSDDAKPDMDAIPGTPGERQAEVKRRIQEFLEDSGFEADALKHLQSSDELAANSQDQIAKQNFAAASEPAAEAARELRQTAAALRADNAKQAKNQLADALLQLTAAAGNVRKAAQAKSDSDASAQMQKAEDAVREAAKRLETEAQHLEVNGQTNAAARLGEMKELLQSQSLKQMQALARKSPRDAARSEPLAQRLEALAERAAQLGNQGQPTRQEVARLLDRMQRTQANLRHLASQCSGQTPGNSASASTHSSSANAMNRSGEQPLSRSRGAEPSRDELRRQLGENLMQELREQMLDAMGVKPNAPELGQMRGVLGRNTGNDSSSEYIVPLATELDRPLNGVIAMLRQELAHYQRQHQLTDQQVAQAPEAYRPAVADYFEHLSRDYATGNSTNDSPSK